MSLRPDLAIEKLQHLRDEASSQGLLVDSEQFTAWKAKIRGVISASLGRDDHLIERFDAIRYSPNLWTDGMPAPVWERIRAQGIREACGVIDAAIFHLQILCGETEPVDFRSFDPKLWVSVQQLVHDQDWAKVASQTAIFVEHQIRVWAGDPKNKNGESLYGHALMGRVFADESDWRLGVRPGEREGWRALATGFMQAISNVDRHRIQEREDARRYAIGVLGLGSLLLTQMRYEHGEFVEATSEHSTDPH